MSFANSISLRIVSQFPYAIANILANILLPVNQLKPFLNQIGTRTGNFFSVNQVIIIVDLIGPPSEVDVVYPTINKSEKGEY